MFVLQKLLKKERKKKNAMFCYVLKEHVEFSPRPFSCLHRYCEAGWVEQHEAVMLFREALPDIVTKKLRMTIWLGESEGHK